LIHRSLVAVGALLLALLLAAPALAARVHVRVEGATTTIFGATEPLVTPVRGTITPPAGTAVTVTADTPLGALERASRLGEFYYRLEAFSFGPYVAQIGRRPGAGTTGWVFKVNGKSPPVGADKHVLRNGDRVLWYFARFGPAGGPKTLHLRGPYFVVADCFDAPCPELTSGPCYDAYALDDNGRRSQPGRVSFQIDGRTVRSRTGTICPRGDWRTLRAARPGHVRSQLVTRPRGRVPGGGAALAGRPR
jgi:hypothetical protein